MPDSLNSDTLTIDNKPCKHLAENARFFLNLSVCRVWCQHSVGQTGCVTCACDKESKATMAAQVSKTTLKTRQVWSLGLDQAFFLHEGEKSHLVVKYFQHKKTRAGKSAATAIYYHKKFKKSPKSPCQIFHQSSRKFTTVSNKRKMYIDSTCSSLAIPWVTSCYVTDAMVTKATTVFVSVKH